MVALAIVVAVVHDAANMLSCTRTSTASGVEGTSSTVTTVTAFFSTAPGFRAACSEAGCTGGLESSVVGVVVETFSSASGAQSESSSRSVPREVLKGGVAVTVAAAVTVRAPAARMRASEARVVCVIFGGVRLCFETE